MFNSYLVSIFQKNIRIELLILISSLILITIPRLYPVFDHLYPLYRNSSFFSILGILGTLPPERVSRILVRVLRLMSTLILQFEYDQRLERARQAPGDPGMARVAPGGPGSKALGAQCADGVLLFSGYF
jgi:hypothetical protein